MRRFLLNGAVLMAFLLGATNGARATGTCPPSPSEGIEGWIRCGDLRCPSLVHNAISSGQSCTPRIGVYCCQGGGPRMQSQEGAEFEVRFLYPNGDDFDGLRKRRAVWAVVNGEVIDRRGQFDGTYLTFPGGVAYLLLAGDLFLVEVPID